MYRLSRVAIMLLLSIGFLVPTWLYAASDSRCFNVPGITNCIDGRFREYWEQNGGLAVFGYPISAAATQQTVDGSFLTQYFERNRFELHPEKARPYDVLLGRLGDDRLKQQGRDWFSLPKGHQTDGCRWFAATGHSVCDQEAGVGFRSYWEGHGLQDPALGKDAQSLALFGLPLSEPTVETNAAGATVLTQWFERARFEYYPDNQGAFKVLLGLLGNEMHAQPVPQPTATPQPTSPPRADPCAGIAAPVNATITPNCLKYRGHFFVNTYGFAPNAQIGFWITDEHGTTVGSAQTITTDNTGARSGNIYTDDYFGFILPTGNYVFVAQDPAGTHISTAPFRIIP
ncbi:MAG: hypothetical protein NVS2B7_10250 [Herpetosiphon sp.]